MKQNQPTGDPRSALFFAGLAAISVAMLVYAASIPGDEKNALVLGYSLARLTLMGLLLILFLLSSLIGYAAFRGKPLAERLVHIPRQPRWRQRLVFLAGLAFLIGYLAFFMPPYWFGSYHAYFVRLRPLVFWFGLAGLQTFLVFNLPGAGGRLRLLISALRVNRSAVKAITASLGVLVGIWVLIALTGLGIKSEPYFWNEAGAPVLGIQLIFSLLLVLAYSQLGIIENKNRPWVDLAAALGLYLLALFLWSQVPVMRSYFTPGPYLPGNVFHPFSDAAVYDVSAQYLLIGQGIANGQYMDKPFYVLLLAIFRLLGGQDYEKTILAQTAFLAVMPVAGYLLGKAVMNRNTGLLVGLLVIFQQFNALNATPFIQVSHSKMMMTEYPSAMLIIFASLAAFKWLSGAHLWPLLAMASGGLIGLAGLARPNALALLPVLLLFAIITFRKQIKSFLVGAVVCLLAFAAVVGPWFLETPSGFSEPYLVAKIRAVIDTRYIEPRLPLETETRPEEPLSTSNSGLLKPTAEIRVTTADSQAQNQAAEITSLPFVPNHFFHNQVMAFFILPHTIELKNLKETLETPYWLDVRNWQGELPADTSIFVFFNLTVLSLGIGISWRRWRTAGLLPLGFMLFYFLANAVARTSGARYLVPVDWILLVYFSIGVLVLMKWIGTILLKDAAKPDLSDLEAQDRCLPVNERWTHRVGGAAAVLAGFLVLGLALPLSKHAFPVKYKSMQTHEVLEMLSEDGYLSFTSEELRNYMTSQSPLAVQGLGLYPRHYPAEAGEPLNLNDDPAILQLRPRSYTRLTMTVLSPEGHYIVILPVQEVPLDLPSGIDVAVVGCWNGPEYFLDAIAFFALTDPPITLWRDNNAGLTCPQPAPIK